MRLYDKSQIDFDHLLFDRRALLNLVMPLVLEQLLQTLMGMADTIMVSRVGSAAISAVSLVDAINVLVIQVFAAMATGAAIICSYYIGRKDRRGANEAARQVLLSLTVISVVITAVCLLLNRQILSLVFGSVEPEVMENSQTYFYVTAVSFTFIALTNAGAAFYRAGGNSRFPLSISIIANGVNIAGNALLIFGLGWGVFGAALATLVSRVVNAVVLLYYLRKDRQEIVVRDYLKIRPNWPMIRDVLHIGIPSGIENGMFQFGKLAIQSSVSTLGTAAIAAQALTILMESLNGIAGVGVGIAMMTVVGQCIGAGRMEEAKFNIVRLDVWSEILIVLSCLAVYLLTPVFIALAALEPDSAALVHQMILFITVTKPFVWVASFTTVNGLRAAGDVRFPMIVSTITMWGCRVLMSTVLIRVFHFGPIAVWIGMASDWLIRGIIFTVRFVSGRWLNHMLVQKQPADS